MSLVKNQRPAAGAGVTQCRATDPTLLLGRRSMPRRAGVTGRALVVTLLVAALPALARAQDAPPPEPATQPAAAPATRPAAELGPPVPPAAPRHEPGADAAAGGEEEIEKDPSDSSDGPWSRVWRMTELSTLWYLRYEYDHDDDPESRFNIGRGYVTLKLRPLAWLGGRVTMDTHQDGEGDWEVRLKYLYGQLTLPIETAIISLPHIEFGLVHTPWFDFEEHINRYRMEGTMFLERNGLMNSADAGVTLVTLLGKKLPDEYLGQHIGKYPGQYGSVALGVYNGGGYHAAETNDNKVFQSRVTLRPLWFILPGLQLSHFFVIGRGNTPEAPDWLIHDFMLSVEQRYFVLTGQVGFGEGNQKGVRLDASGEALDFVGASGFAELKLPWIRSAVIGRLDWFDWGRGSGEPAEWRVIAGYALWFYRYNALLLSLDHVSYDDDSTPADWSMKLTLQLNLP